MTGVCVLVTPVTTIERERERGGGVGGGGGGALIGPCERIEKQRHGPVCDNRSALSQLLEVL